MNCSKNSVSYDLCLFDPFVEPNAVIAYESVFKELGLNVILFTFNYATLPETQAIKIYHVKCSKIFRFTPRLSDIAYIYKSIITSNLRILVWMFEFFSLGNFFLSMLRSICRSQFKILTYSFENQLISDSFTVFQKSVHQFGFFYAVNRLARRLLRFFIYETLLNPRVFIQSGDIHIGCSGITKKFLLKRGLPNKAVIECKYPVFVPIISTPRTDLKDVFVGRLVEEKGIIELVNAYNSKYNVDFRVLHVIGDGVMRNECMLLNTKNLVVFHGRQSLSSVYYHIASSQNLILPSIDVPNWSEQYPRVIEEATVLSTPVIARNNVTLKSIWGDRVSYIEEFCNKNFFDIAKSNKCKNDGFVSSIHQFSSLLEKCINR